MDTVLQGVFSSAMLTIPAPYLRLGTTHHQRACTRDLRRGAAAVTRLGWCHGHMTQHRVGNRSTCTAASAGGTGSPSRSGVGGCLDFQRSCITAADCSGGALPGQER
jgi:hypothetical protein